MALTAKATSGANPGSGSTTLSWTHTVGAGDDRCIWIGCYNSDSTDPTCTVGGNAATVVDSQEVAFSRPLRVWRYLMPAVGTVTIEISFGAFAFNRAGVAISYSGVDQTTPENDLNKFGTFFDEQGVLIDATPPDNVTLSFTGARDPAVGTPDLTATGSAAFDEERINSNIVVALASATTAGAEVVHSSSTPMDVNWGVIGFSVNPASGGGGSAVPGKSRHYRNRRAA